MKKTTILFGAGAEPLSTGLQFALSVIGYNNANMNEAIKEFYSSFPENDWHDKYVENTIPIDKLVEASVRREYLSAELMLSSQKDIDREIDRVKESCSLEEQQNLIQKYTSYLGIIDSDFHTLIYPKVFGRYVFWRAIDCFARAYLCLVKDILNPPKDSKQFYLDVLKKPNDTYQEMIKTIQNDERFTKESYYTEIRKIMHKYNDAPIRIVSTNYTPCCSVITGRDDIIHIHGRMDMFENPYEWKVIRAEEAQKNNEGEERKLLFPYLAIQSGVKPIIERTQITEYNKMVEAFDCAEKIIIVGYGINYDDNHINSIIRNAVENKDKQVVVLCYETGTPKPKVDVESEICHKLRLDYKPFNLNVIQINNSNCVNVFRSQLIEE